MANYKLVDAEKLDADLQTIADAIKAKTGDNSTLVFPTDFAAEIANITGGGGGSADNILDNVSASPNFSKGNFVIDAGQGNTMRTATVIKPDMLKPENIKLGVTIAGVIGTYDGGASVTESGTFGNGVDWALYSNGKFTISGTGETPNYTATYGSNPYTNNPAYIRRDSITMVVIEEGITSVGDYLFYGNTNLIGVVIPNGITQIGENAFAGCSSLCSVTIPDTVTTIGKYAFKNDSALTSLTLGTGVTTIGKEAFSNCKNLAEVHIDPAAWCYIAFSGSAASPVAANSEVKLYSNGAIITEVVVPNGVAQINNYAFYGYKTLTKVTIPSSVTKIGINAFDGTGLESAIFEKTSWTVNVSGTPTVDVSNPETAATLLRQTYRYYEWTRN